MAEAKRRKGESFEALLRRFNKRMQMSGGMLEAKKRRHFVRKPSANGRRASALRRLQIGVKRAYLEKVGLLVEEPRSVKK
ncbi:MAG: 30S ribosomal protein S21 [Patescibacteria group bacterium]